MTRPRSSSAGGSSTAAVARRGRGTRPRPPLLGPAGSSALSMARARHQHADGAPVSNPAAAARRRGRRRSATPAQLDSAAIECWGDVEVGQHRHDAEEDGGEADDPDNALLDRRSSGRRARRRPPGMTVRTAKDASPMAVTSPSVSVRVCGMLRPSARRLRPPEGDGHQRPWQEHRDTACCCPRRVEACCQAGHKMAGQENVDPASVVHLVSAPIDSMVSRREIRTWSSAPRRTSLRVIRRRTPVVNRLADDRRRHRPRHPEARRDREYGAVGQPALHRRRRRGDGARDEAQLAEHAPCRTARTTAQGIDGAHGQVRKGRNPRAT